MRTKPVHHRTVEAVVGSVIWRTLRSEPRPSSIRHRAIIEVLCRVPDPWFARLDEKAATFEWFIPEKYEFAGIFSFQRTRLFYLGHVLEQRSLSWNIATVGHEFAHIALDHGNSDVSQGEHQEEERKARELAISWGFEREERKYQEAKSVRLTAEFERLTAEFDRRRDPTTT